MPVLLSTGMVYRRVVVPGWYRGRVPGYGVAVGTGGGDVPGHVPGHVPCLGDVAVLTPGTRALCRNALVEGGLQASLVFILAAPPHPPPSDTAVQLRRNGDISGMARMPAWPSVGHKGLGQASLLPTSALRFVQTWESCPRRLSVLHTYIKNNDLIRPSGPKVLRANTVTGP